MGWGTTNVSAGGGEEDKLKAHLENKNNPHGVTAEQVGAAKADHTHTAAQVGARPNTWTPKLADVAFLGNQPISAVANDTTANWANLGSGYAWYSAGGLLNDQPAQYGFLLNYVNGSVCSRFGTHRAMARCIRALGTPADGAGAGRSSSTRPASAVRQ